MAPALFVGFTSTVGAVSETWTFCCLHFNRHRDVEPERLIGDHDIVVFVERESGSGDGRACTSLPADVLNSYIPWALLWTTIGDPVAGVMITLAPEIAAAGGIGDLSAERPRTAVCANNALADSKNKNAMTKKRTYLSTFI